MLVSCTSVLRMKLALTFATEFSDELSLSEAMEPANIARYNAKKTGEKFLINPSK